MGYHYLLIIFFVLFGTPVYTADAGFHTVPVASCLSSLTIDDALLRKNALEHVMRYVVSARFISSPDEHDTIWTQQVSPAFWRLYNTYDLLGAQYDIARVIKLVTTKCYCGNTDTVASSIRDMLFKTFTYVLLNKERLDHVLMQSYQELMNIYFDARLTVVQTEIERAEVLYARDLFLLTADERRKKFEQQLASFYHAYDDIFKK